MALASTSHRERTGQVWVIMFASPLLKCVLLVYPDRVPFIGINRPKGVPVFGRYPFFFSPFFSMVSRHQIITIFSFYSGVLGPA